MNGTEVGPVTMVTLPWHSQLPLGVEELSLRSPHPALGQASRRLRSLTASRKPP